MPAIIITIRPASVRVLIFLVIVDILQGAVK